MMNWLKKLFGSIEEKSTSSSHTSEPDKKKCPFCDEDITCNDVICQYCGSHLGIPERSYDLKDWWLSEFTKKERKHIETVLFDLSKTTGWIISNFSAYAGHFRKPEDRHIARKILQKALEYLDDAPVLHVHFLFHQIIQTYYPDRENPDFMDVVIDACHEQINLAKEAAKAFEVTFKNRPVINHREYGPSSLPAHVGYKQYAIILEKEKRYDEVIALCREAAHQGWAGDWDKRIERCKKKSKKGNI